MTKFILFSLLLIGCVSNPRLSESGEKVRLMRRPLSESCVLKADLTALPSQCRALPYSDEMNGLRNRTARLGGTHLSLTSDDDCRAEAYLCAESFDLPRAEQLARCKKGDVPSCLDYASAEDDDREVLLTELFSVRKQLCESGRIMSCSDAERAAAYLAKLERAKKERETFEKEMKAEKERLGKLSEGCKIGKGKDCTEIALTASRHKQFDLAIRFSELGCAKGYLPSCELHKGYIAQKSEIATELRHREALEQARELEDRKIALEEQRLREERSERFRQAIQSAFSSGFNSSPTLNCTTRPDYLGGTRTQCH